MPDREISVRIGRKPADFKFLMFLSTQCMWVHGVYRYLYMVVILGFCVHTVHCFHWDCTSIARRDDISGMAIRRPILDKCSLNMTIMI